MARLSYSRDEILAEHAYAKPQIEAGYRLHGGFDAAGHYISPRTLHRWPAIRAWQEALKARGGEIIDASQQLMVRGSFPTVAQQSFLLELGLGQTLWDALSITGVIEARGLRLTEATAPDFQSIIVEDISQTATGHLNKGLLYAHGLDEGGNRAKGEGGHDFMWFAVRDLLFGKNAYPESVVPESIGWPELGRLMPQIPKDYEEWILLLMNVLMIEVRAENFFSFCTTVMRAPENFRDRREAALHAADLVDRIRQDEAPHVGYLAAVISELRSVTFTTVDGGRIAGREMIDPIWRGMVNWHAVTNVDFERQRTRDALTAMLAARDPDLVHRFDSLADEGSRMIKEFKGKTAYITGGASGIGLSMARAFGKQGMNVVLADIDEAAAKAAAERLTSEQIKAKGVHVDVGDRNSVRASALEAVSAFGKIYIVCNNAGVAVGGMFGMMKERDWDWIIDVNLKGVVYGAETFVPLIKSHGEGGHIVNTASVAGMISGPGLEPYSATKYAVVAMSEGWAMQLSGDKIGVSILCPGFVRTRIHESARARQDRYGGVNAEMDPGIAATRDMASQAVLSGIDPDVVGARVVEAVKNGELYIFTHPTMRPVIEMRLNAIKAALDACDNSEALKGVKDFGGGSAFLAGQQ